MNANLKRELNTKDSIFLGMGSMVGTGVFVTLGLAASLSGTNMLIAIFIAACLAFCNGISSAQLASNYPTSGGTYEYARRTLNPHFGFVAGVFFVLAKSASAATAAIGFASYATRLIGLSQWQVILSITAVLGISLVCLNGIKRSSKINTIIVSLTLVALSYYTLRLFKPSGITPLLSQFDIAKLGQADFFESIALIFVAYTGYGRVATLAEEVRDPGRSIPRAIIATVLSTFVLYLLVALVSLSNVGGIQYGYLTQSTAAPLFEIARLTAKPDVVFFLELGALTAMLGVLLNLVLGVSRVVFAMGRAQDLPVFFAETNEHKVPHYAVMFTGLLIGLLSLIGNIKLTWSVSAFCVLIYYALTNLSALKLTKEQRFAPRLVSWLGLAGCVFLAFFIEWDVLVGGLALLASVVIGHFVFKPNSDSDK